MKTASIDLGTNTCLLLVKETLASGEERILHDESTVVRLGQGVDQSGELNVDAMKRALECISKYSQIASTLGVEPSRILAVGTAQARDAKNAAQFFNQVQTETGVQFKVLTGDEEARATFLGAALPEMDIRRMVVMDIGGGSTELVAMPQSQMLGQSLNIGAVRMTERFLKSDPVTDDEFWNCEAAIDQALSSMIPWRQGLEKEMGKGLELVAVAGTAVTLAMLQLAAKDYDRNLLDGFKISRGDAHRLVEELKWRSVQERKLMTGMEVKRADVILAGAMIFWRVMEVLNFSHATVSTRGLRYGVLFGA